MVVYNNWDNIKTDPNNVLTVGTFDGVHLGHKYIISELLSIAASLKGSPTVVTFNPHPKIVLQNADRDRVQILTTTDEKIELMSGLGIKKLVVIHFTRDFSRLNAEDFVKDILFEKIGCKGMVTGYDHAFGRNREGGLDTLKSLAAALNFEVFRLNEFQSVHGPFSSTRIRKLLQAGDVGVANKLLGYPYFVTGKVIRGDGRGKQIGFPTANVSFPNPIKLLPQNGVYIIDASVDNNIYSGMANIGTRPTFDGRETLLEANLFDFDKDIYGSVITVRFYDKIRDEIKFESVNNLAVQLQNDKKTSLEYLRVNKLEI